jgi:hypothetical protein
MPLEPDEFQKLKVACSQLPPTTVQAEEAELARSPVLILMSTVLSLNRRWYSHALRARRCFQEGAYADIDSRTLVGFRELANSRSQQRTDWSALARHLWGMNEWDKARMLTQWVDYLLDWRDQNASDTDDLELLRQWSATTSKKEFVGRIKGLGPRAFEQLMWYVEGRQAIKLDRHVREFFRRAIPRALSDDETIDALKLVAQELEISATELDARIWDQMQAGSRRS